MSGGNRLFWGVIAVLLGSSVYYGTHAEARRREVQQSEATLQDGTEVALVSVVDGDTVVVRDEEGASVAVRLLGVKSFDPTRDKQAESRFGRNAMDALGELMRDRAVLVALHDPPKDKYGRTLARLSVDGRDLGLHLVEQGLVLVYTAFPFPQMDEYLEHQARARAGKLGLWANSEVARQADLFDREWRRAGAANREGKAR